MKWERFGIATVTDLTRLVGYRPERDPVDPLSLRRCFVCQLGEQVLKLSVGLLGLGLAVSCSASEEGTMSDYPSNATRAGSSTAVKSGTGGSSSVALGSTSRKSSISGIDIGAIGGTGNEAVSTIGPSLNSCVPQPDDTGCVGAAYEGESVSLDILVMFDLSCSMSCTVDQSGCCSILGGSAPDMWRIQPVRSAMRAFLKDPLSAGIGVGLTFFGNHPLTSFLDPVVCSVDNYSRAKVAIAPLPDNADALISALDAGTPEGGTPTHLAIDGACIQASNWKTSNPGRKIVILLVTDGIPELSCGATIQQAVGSATNCFDNGRGTETYVLGISSNNYGLGSSLSQLNQIAVAGGTQQAYLTDTANVAESVLAALNAIRADATIHCDLTIPKPPSGQAIAADKINLGICSPGAQPMVTPYVPSGAECGDSPGWYYDRPTSPAMIRLCSATCQAVMETGSTLFFSVGCKTKDSTLIL